jgi:cytidylate kinase
LEPIGRYEIISAMKREYDFSSAVRGKFFRKGAELNVPIYVDGPMHKRLERLAKRKGKPVADLVNQLLKRDLELLESLS